MGVFRDTRLLIPQTFINCSSVEEIGIVDYRVNVTAHELLHAWLQTIGMPSPETFWYTWEANREKYSILRDIDEILATYPLYKDIEDNWFILHERFAHLGEKVGCEGLKNIPKELRPFYQYIFEQSNKNFKFCPVKID